MFMSLLEIKVWNYPASKIVNSINVREKKRDLKTSLYCILQLSGLVCDKMPITIFLMDKVEAEPFCSHAVKYKCRH